MLNLQRVCEAAIDLAMYVIKKTWAGRLSENRGRSERLPFRVTFIGHLRRMVGPV